MPEMPEVSALAQALTQRTSGLVVARVDIVAVNALKTVDPPVSALQGATLLGWTRRGKHLVADLADSGGEPLHLVLHLARGGWVRWRDTLPRAAPRPAGGRGAGAALALRIALVTPHGADAGGLDVTEAGTQKRLAVHVVRDPNDVPRVAALGPDPLSAGFDRATLHGILAAAGRSQLKGVLCDQSRIAGIGNAYSDEILHAAGLSPFAPAGTLRPEAEEALFDAVRTTLSHAVMAAETVDPTLLKEEKRAAMAVHGRAGESCPVCGDVIRDVSFADSSLQYCPTCQTGGRPLADRRMSRLLK